MGWGLGPRVERTDQMSETTPGVAIVWTSDVSLTGSKVTMTIQPAVRPRAGFTHLPTSLAGRG